MARVTLTFDNGPEPDVTHQVLDTLAERGIKATFFVIGQKLESPEGRAAVERAHGEGHWIGNHSYTHSVSLGNSDDPDIFDAEITRTQELIGALGHPDKLFRPFANAGVIDHRIFKHRHIEQLESAGYTCVMYERAVKDWEDADAWVGRALDTVNEHAWTTLVLHDIVGYPQGTITNGMKNLVPFLDQLAAEGHEIVQEVAPVSMPIVRGRLVGPIEHLCN